MSRTVQLVSGKVSEGQSGGSYQANSHQRLEPSALNPEVLHPKEFGARDKALAKKHYASSRNVA